MQSAATFVQSGNEFKFEIPNEYGFVKVGSIWERDDRGNLIGGDVHMDSLDDDSDFGWLEMPLEDLRENFVLIE